MKKDNTIKSLEKENKRLTLELEDALVYIQRDTKTIWRQQVMIDEFKETLVLIAASKRSDGTYNRSREACEQLAKEVLIKNKRS